MSKMITLRGIAESDMMDKASGKSGKGTVREYDLESMNPSQMERMGIKVE